MKNYNKFVLWGIIFSLLIPVFGVCQEKEEERDLLMGILDDTGAIFLEGDINVGGTIIDRFIKEEEIEEIGDKIRIGLDIKKDLPLQEEAHTWDLDEEDYYSEELIEDDGFIQLMVQGFDDSHNFITFILSSYQDIEDSHSETSLFINLIKKEQFVEFNDIIEKVENIFEEYNVPVDVTTCIVGTFDGDFNLDEKEKTILSVTKAIKGKIVEQYREDDILSFSIFTPYIEKYIYTGSKKMNLNIAVRYNEYEDKTYIWIGTPIITIGY